MTVEPSGTPTSGRAGHHPSNPDPTFAELSDTIARYPDPDDKLTIALGNFNRVRAERDALRAALAAVENSQEPDDA